MKKEKKSLQELTLMDRFLFAEAMERPGVLQNLLEIILGKDIVLKELPQTEKEQRTSTLNRFFGLMYGQLMTKNQCIIQRFKSRINTIFQNEADIIKELLIVNYLSQEL